MIKKFSGIGLAAVICLSAVTPSISQVNYSAAADANMAVFYVSPDGNDSGKGTKDDPFRTITAARDAVRRINSNMSGDISVYLMDGEYRITEPIEFDTRDSGTNGHMINYRSYSGGAVINGATKVTGWQKGDGDLWLAPLDRDIKLRNLYVNDKRANMGSVTVQCKGGVGEYSITAGQADWAWDSGKKSDGLAYDPNSIPRITSDFDDLEVINGTTWNENIVCTRDVKFDGNSLILYLQQPYGAIAQTPGWGAGFSASGTHTIYNSLSFVDEPGEFYFSKSEKKLYYYPRNGEDMASADVEAPVADMLIKIEGNSLTERVENISFSDITFENTDYQLTEVDGSHGKATCQAAQSYIAFADSNWHSKKYEMADTLPAMISVRSSKNINFTDNVVKHSGSDGISMTNDVVDSKISGNFVTDITSSGITIDHPQHVYIGDAAWNNHEKFPKEVEGVCKNIEITDNYLYDISVVHGFGGCAAITTYYGDSVKILRNTVEKTAYNGIHLGWGWCNFTDSETCRDNQICYNRVINCLNRLHDSGGIYTIGQMPGTVINENYVQGIPAAGAYQPTYGLHNDEGTAYIEENDNVLEISPNVTYTINCEDFGSKHHLTIKCTYATVNKMGKNPPDSDIDAPIVVTDDVWDITRYKICLNSGVTDDYAKTILAGITSAADYAFPASCATTGGSTLPIRKTGSTIWIAPDGTTSFKTGLDMTKASGSATSIKTPKAEGEYRVYAVDASGNVLSKSDHILRISGTGGDVIEAEAYTVQSGIQTENCSEGGSDVAYIENGDYIGFKGVDFGKDTDSLSFRIGANGGGNSIEVHLGSPDGKLIGTVEVKSTGGWQTWATQTCSIPATSGIQDVYLVFKGGDGYLFNLNWWSVNRKDNGDEVEHDLNGDGEFDKNDLVLLADYLLGKKVELVDHDAGDMNGDGKLDTFDLCLMRKEF